MANNVILLGRLTKDPELKYSKEGKAIVRFTLAVNREYNREESDFINCIAFEKRGETIAEYFKKGNRILVQGRIQTGSYENKSGQKVYTTDIVVDKFEFIENNKNNENGETKYGGSNTIEESGLDDDFPFN